MHLWRTGQYTATLTCSDAVGNTSLPTSKIVRVDNTLPTATLAVSNAAFSPIASPGAKDTTTFTVRVTDVTAVHWTFDITNSSSTIVKTFVGTGNAAPVWNGKNSSSNATAPDGLYTATLTYADSSGNTGATTSKTVRIDNSAPTATALTASNAIFSPATSIGIKDTTLFNSTIADAVTVSWTLDHQE